MLNLIIHLVMFFTALPGLQKAASHSINLTILPAITNCFALQQQKVGLIKYFDTVAQTEEMIGKRSYSNWYHMCQKKSITWTKIISMAYPTSKAQNKGHITICLNFYIVIYHKTNCGATNTLKMQWLNIWELQLQYVRTWNSYIAH